MAVCRDYRFVGITSLQKLSVCRDCRLELKIVSWQIYEKVYENVYENGLTVKLQIKISSIKIQNKQKKENEKCQILMIR